MSANFIKTRPDTDVARDVPATSEGPITQLSTLNALAFGCGPHMLEHLMPVLSCHDKVKPKWCIDLDHSRSKKCANIFGIRAVTSVQECENVDLIVSAVRPTSSMSVLETGVQLKCPVFLEKPGGLSMAHLNELEAYATKNKMGVWFGYNYKHSNMAQSVKSLLEREIAISCEYTFLSLRPLEIENGEESLFECWLKGNAVHLMALISYLHGDGISLVSKNLCIDGDKFILVADYKDRTNCLIRIRIGNKTAKFVFNSQISTASGAVIKTNGFDSVVIERDNISETIYKSSTFNKIRSKDGFYEQFSTIVGSGENTASQFAEAKNAMQMACELLG